MTGQREGREAGPALDPAAAAAEGGRGRSAAPSGPAGSARGGVSGGWGFEPHLSRNGEYHRRLPVRVPPGQAPPTPPGPFCACDCSVRLGLACPSPPIPPPSSRGVRVGSGAGKRRRGGLLPPPFLPERLLSATLIGYRSERTRGSAHSDSTHGPQADFSGGRVTIFGYFLRPSLLPALDLY